MRAFVSFLILSALSHSLAFAKPTQLDFKYCQVTQGAQILDAQCATLIRPLDPSQPNGETIDLFVAKFPALNPDPEQDAFTVIQGGPGGSSIDLFMSSHRLFRKIRANRDVLVVDQRGTGRSNILLCPSQSTEEQLAGFDPVEVKRLAINCIEELDTDLRFYTTSLAVQDLDAMREAAGYEQLTIYGISYGTRVAQHYLRRFPEATRAVILDGVVDVELNLAGGEIARRSQAAFDNMAKRCVDSNWCTEQFGDLKLKFESLRKRLIHESIEFSFAHPVSGANITESINETHLLTAVRLMPYSTEQLALLPMIISDAHAGNYVSLAAFSKMLNEGFFENYAIGMNNSVMCAEDTPFVETSDLVGIEETYFGNDMANAILAVCEVWPQGSIDDDFHEPFSSEKPVLILSGETDPITPPENGEKAHQMLANSKHLIVPAHGHGVIGRGCVPQIVTEFVENANFDELNSACIEREKAQPFFFDYTGPKP